MVSTSTPNPLATSIAAVRAARGRLGLCTMTPVDLQRQHAKRGRRREEQALSTPPRSRRRRAGHFPPRSPPMPRFVPSPRPYLTQSSRPRHFAFQSQRNQVTLRGDDPPHEDPSPPQPDRFHRSSNCRHARSFILCLPAASGRARLRLRPASGRQSHRASTGQPR